MAKYKVWVCLECEYDDIEAETDEKRLIDANAEKGKIMARYKIDCCFECTQRFPTCHATCAIYKQQKAEYDLTMEEVRKSREVRVGLNGFMYNSIERTNKHLHRKGR